MDLWIRSQNKRKITRVNEIYLDNVLYEDGSVDIIGNKFILGHYKESRALEILDEIQNILKPQMVLSKLGKPIAETCDGLVYTEPNEYEIKELLTCVYEMPNE